MNRLMNILFISLSMISSTFAQDEPETLQEALAERAAASAQKVPTESSKIMLGAIDALRERHMEENALKVGDALPDGTLVDVHGKQTSIKEQRSGKKVIVTFYRGGWCPYCNLQLHYFQKALPQIKALGAELIAISPETPDNTLSTSEKNKLEFTVLSDSNNHYARELGLVYSLPNDLVGVYKNFGIDLESSNNSKNWELPLSATFVVDEQGKVIYRFLDADYKKRANIEELLEALKQ